MVVEVVVVLGFRLLVEGALEDVVLKSFAEVVVLDEEFKVERTELSSHLFIILDFDSLNKVFEKIGLPPV